jgi:predicted acyltransferase
VRLNHGGSGHYMSMIIIGLVLLLLGLVLGIPILWTAGFIVLIVGLVLMLLGRTGRRVGGRAHYW